MRLSLSGKLFLTALTLAVLAVALVLSLTWWSLGRGFSVYVTQNQLNRLERLADQLVTFAEVEGLEQIAGNPHTWEALLIRGLAPTHRSKGDKAQPAADRPGKAHRLTPAARSLGARLALLAPDGAIIIGPPEAAESEVRRPLTSDDRLLGWLALAPPKRLAEGIHSRFVETQGRNLLIIGLGTVLLAGLAALLLGRHLGRPIIAMAKTTQGLRDGNYQMRVAAEERHDEIGSLARDINALAAALESAEAGRKRWVQDTAHELRTPLASLRAEVEALQDGVRQADEKSFARLHAGIMTLAGLIEDLRALADADGGRLNLELTERRLWPLIEGAVDALRNQAGARDMALSAETLAGEDDIAELDGRRIGQVLRNLVANSLAYSDPGGRIQLALRREGPNLTLWIDDTPPGVPEEHRAHLFDRFYRVEGSRSRATGGRGLGLAICQAIVSAHGGRIAAEPSPLGGLRVVMTLPSAKPSGGRG